MATNDIKREWFDTDYYAVLGVAKDASQADVTKSYRKLAREYHPDTNPGDAKAEERFKEISAAYDVIGDEDKRASYDQTRQMGPMGGASRAGNDGFGFDGVDLGDLLGSVFSSGSGGGGLFGDQPGGRYARIKRPGRDQEATLAINFDEAVRGVTTSLRLDDGSGPRTINVRIPAGVDSGQRIRVRGKGGPGDPPGDLYVTVETGTDPIFGRRGANLTLELPVTFAEAALGAEVKVPTYGGESVTVRIPAGTQHGRTLRVRGAGAVPEHKPNPKDRGGAKAAKAASTPPEATDLLVIVHIAIPMNLSKKQTEAMQAFAELDTESPRKHLESRS